ncbi:MAG: carbohydrate ABC transporter permease [Lachnospiraceae bacterium]|nr:carbohydrate ABC transporter permease [Lachnospiraceae bacterium]
MENVMDSRKKALAGGAFKPRAKKKFSVKKKKLYKLGHYVWALCRFLLIFGLGFVILYPLLQVISKTFMPTVQYQDLSVIWIPKSLTLDNVRNAFDYLKFWPSLANTLILGLSCAAIQIIVCALTGYGFARFRFPLREPLFLMVILTIIIPTQIIFLPSFVQYRFFDFFGISRILGLVTGKNYTEFAKNLVDTRWSFWVPSLFGVGLRSGIFIYLFRQCFRNIPKELEEAAKIDGCGSIKTFVSIMLPNAKSTVLTVFLFSLVWHWNEYTLTRTFFPQNYQPLAVRLKLAIDAMTSDLATRTNLPFQMGVTYASVLLFILPVLIIYIFAQRWFVEGVESSGIKG